MLNQGLRIEARNLINDSKVVFEKMNATGMRINRTSVERHLARLTDEQTARLSKWGVKTTSDMKKVALREISGLPGWPRTDAGALSLTSDLAEKNPHLTALVDYVKASSKARLISQLKNLLTGGIHENGKVYPIHKVNDQVGRVYVADFPYVTLQREVRDVILADEDCNLWEIDGKGTELVVLAVMSGDAKLLQVLLTTDFYREMAAEFNGITVKDVTDALRAQMKMLVLAVQNGASARFLGGEMAIPESEAQNWLDRYLGMYPQAAQFLESVKAEARRSGVAHTYFGTRREFPNDSDVERSCASHTIQSFAGEVFRIGMVLMEKMATAAGGRVMGNVFDAFLIPLPKSIPEGEVLAMVGEIEKEFSRFGFPLRLKVTNCGETWK